MTTKPTLIFSGIAALLAAGMVMVYFTTKDWTVKYQQTNATWRIQGLCTNVQNGAAIIDATITAYFHEAVTPKHKWLGTPLNGTNVIADTDDKGHFELTGEGGHVQIKVRAKGFRDPEPWEDWRCSAMNGVTHVDTNIALSLVPYK